MCTTSLMVGLSEGFVAAHKIPSLNTLRISSKYFSSLIFSSRASSMGFPSWKWYRAQSAKLLSSSPSVGPLPVASSKRITPKLYTSVFCFDSSLEMQHRSFTMLVWRIVPSVSISAINSFSSFSSNFWLFQILFTATFSPEDLPIGTSYTIPDPPVPTTLFSAKFGKMFDSVKLMVWNAMGFLQRIDFQTGLTEQGLVKGQVLEGYCQKDDFCCNSMCPMTSKRWFVDTSKVLSFENWPKTIGISPERLLVYSQTSLNAGNLPRPTGMLPPMLFTDKSKNSRAVMLLIFAGIFPIRFA
nr:hypothetical protein Iba_scaffold259CG0240 [Ipomoea batatas]